MNLDMNMLQLIIGTSVVLIILAIGLLIRDLTTKKPDNPLPLDPSVDEDQATLEELAERSGGFSGWFRRTVIESGLPFNSADYFLLMLLVGITIGGAGLLWRDQPMTGVAGLLLGMTVTLIVLVVVRNRRYFAVLKQLPEVTDFLSRSVRAGETLDQAMVTASKNVGKPLVSELSRFTKQMNMGLPFESALKSIARRVPLLEIRMFATTLIVQRHSGGNLVNILDRLTEIMRDRLQYKRQYRASTILSRVSALVITSVAFGIAFYSFILNPENMEAALESSLGKVLIATAFVLLAIGIACILGFLRDDY